MSRISMRWYGGEVTRSLQQQLGKRVQQAATMIANQLADNLDTPGPAPSPPGSFPHAQSRQLLESIKVEHDASGLSSRVLVTAKHAIYVERIRPFFHRTHREMRQRLIAFMSEPLK